MNVYNCLYRGTIGYSCRTRGRNWMFVPEMGQADRRVHRGVSLHELVFADPRAKSWEMNRDARRAGFGWVRNLLGGREESRSVSGMLFTAG
ncbi:MAG TPA: hypothetical protein VIC61_10205 [Gammaproteobacteria bacterium]|jgi:hypothetical protein